MKLHLLAVAAALTLAAGNVARADDSRSAAEEHPQTIAAISPYVKLGEVVYFRSYEDAFPKARKEGKLVLLYRMLGELDGLT